MSLAFCGERFATLQTLTFALIIPHNSLYGICDCLTVGSEYISRSNVTSSNKTLPLFSAKVCLSYTLVCLDFHYHHHHLSPNREGRWGTTDDFATSFFHLSLFSTALWDLASSRSVHFLMSFRLFLCVPCLLPTFTVPCKTVLARPDEREIYPYHCSLRLFTIVRRSSCGRFPAGS